MNLQTDADFTKWGIEWDAIQAAYQQHNITLFRVPIVDFDRDDLEQRILDAGDMLDQILAVGHKAYVHCTAGMERAPATVISYLIQADALSLADAHAEVTSKRNCAPFVDVLERVFNQTVNAS